eukprot:TRINITY_DN7947_c0_g1_i1.p1 TRINITY_DN7947_c0_g1~~TRINITY_DN7947_c0_g1_i1.p1  ORF type:complete len:279 (-),score=59.77 TRINITY_DN7947_c0_g1_i1:273-1109(-)
MSGSHSLHKRRRVESVGGVLPRRGQCLRDEDEEVVDTVQLKERVLTKLEDLRRTLPKYALVAGRAAKPICRAALCMPGLLWRLGRLLCASRKRLWSAAAAQASGHSEEPCHHFGPTLRRRRSLFGRGRQQSAVADRSRARRNVAAASGYRPDASAAAAAVQQRQEIQRIQRAIDDLAVLKLSSAELRPLAPKQRQKLVLRRFKELSRHVHPDKCPPELRDSGTRAFQRLEAARKQALATVGVASRGPMPATHAGAAAPGSWGSQGAPAAPAAWQGFRH